MKLFAKILPLVVAMLITLPAQAERIKDMADIQGVRSNQLIGYGLVVGLDGNGDQTTQTPFTVQSVVSMLGQLGVNLPAGTSLQLKNVAAVTVTATLPPFAKPGQMLDITVSSIGNAKSLRGGTLLMTPLKGADGQIYGMAQGNLMVGGAGASVGGGSAQVNQLSVGRIPNGATVERAVDMPLGQGDYITLELKDSDYTTASRVVTSINRSFGEGTANAENGRVIKVLAPRNINQRVSFLARMENLAVIPGESMAKVIMNARTGSVVMNKSVMVDACAVAHGGLTVTITSEPKVSQPAPLSRGETVVTRQPQIEVKAEKGGLAMLPSSASLNDVVKALNAVGATPQDLLTILQAMKVAGALHAELEVI
ncbi:MAG TPA: flagellar basal body P-ring protein FlgI [Sulfuricella sp.]|nr:flagellar basal body P-ring protein FlgI [Sulfuricella sp.]